MLNPDGEGVGLLLDGAPPSWGGLEEFHFRLCRALKSAGAQPVIVYAGEVPHLVRRQMESTGAIVSWLNYNASPYHYYCGITEFIKKYNIKLVYIRSFNYFRALFWLVRLTGVCRIVFTEANSGIVTASRWKKHLLALRGYFLTLPISQVLTVSGYIKSLLSEVGVSPERIEIIHNGTDLERFSPNPQIREQWRSQFQIHPREIVVATVSFLRRWKNPQTILQACGLLAKRGVPVRLIIAGDGEMREELEQLSQSLAISDKIHWLGHFPHPEKVLQACDIFTLASVGEACANVLCEAMACGVPIVASDSGGNPELIDDGKTGFLAIPLDAADFADKIQRLAEDAGLRFQMGRAGRERAHRQFAVDTTVANYMSVFEAVWNQ